MPLIPAPGESQFKASLVSSGTNAASKKSYEKILFLFLFFSLESARD